MANQRLGEKLATGSEGRTGSTHGTHLDKLSFFHIVHLDVGAVSRNTEPSPSGLGVFRPATCAVRSRGLVLILVPDDLDDLTGICVFVVCLRQPTYYNLYVCRVSGK